MGGHHGLPAGLAGVFPGLLGQQLAVAAQDVGRQDFGVVADLFAGNEVVFAGELHVVLALGAKFNAVGDGTVLVALINGADGCLYALVPLADVLFPLFGGKLHLGF